MCGRYLIEEEAYSDILEILYRAGKLSPISHSADGGIGSGTAAPSAEASADALPYALKEALVSSMHSDVSETLPGDVRGLFPGAPVVVTNGEVFPTNIAPVLVGGSDGVDLLKWGFPHWKNNSVIINARAETALEKRMFRDSLLTRRCVIPSCGFFEWGAGKLDNLQIGMLGTGTRENADFTRSRRSRKVKYLLRLPGENKLYMAGFWSTFRDNANAAAGVATGYAGGVSAVADGSSCVSAYGDRPGNAERGEYNAFIILTTAASDSVSPIHDRMPLILSPDECGDWLGSIEFMDYVLHRPGPELVPEAA